eukprot:2865151-Prymnesium_polylepis.2
MPSRTGPPGAAPGAVARLVRCARGAGRAGGVGGGRLAAAHVLLAPRRARRTAQGGQSRPKLELTPSA